MTERDTHFANAAKLLHDKLQAIMLEALDGAWNNIDMDRRQRECIAHFAYDLAVHAICAYDETPRDFAIEMIEHIPDLMKWPETSEQLDTSPPH